MRDENLGNWRVRWAMCLLVTVAGAALVGCGGSSGAIAAPADPFAAADMARGGLLYDKWWVINGGAEPVSDHPDYPNPPGTKTGSTTWRCKECHGWDYEGVLGAYGSGSHYTGLGGVLDDVGDDPNALFAAIKGSVGVHDFSAVLSDTDVWDLVKFVKQGVIDNKPHINLGTKAALGNAVLGGPLFDNACIGCHGYTGRKIQFSPGEGVGDLANGNPWETLHKIRWGHPGSPMPSQVVAGLSEADHGNILAYAQTLAQGPLLSYAVDIHGLWTQLTCINCHSGGSPAGGMDLSGAAPATLAIIQAGRIDSVNEVNSKILTKPLHTAAGGVVHGGGNLFADTTDANYRKILQWLEEGEAP